MKKSHCVVSLVGFWLVVVMTLLFSNRMEVYLYAAGAAVVLSLFAIFAYFQNPEPIGAAGRQAGADFTKPVESNQPKTS
jgi:hypothetical protein